MVNKKGLFMALMTVAFAGWNGTGHALAPVVTDPGDVVIGDAESTTPTNVFVFPDAFNLDNIVSDDTTLDASIRWSFSGTGKYRINDIGPINVGVEDPNDPALVGKELRSSVGDSSNHPKGGGLFQDSSGVTATFRNETLSPIATGGGFGPYGDPGSVGILGAETQPVTLYASDTATYSQVTIVVYTANDSSDTISGSALTNIFDYDYTNPTFRTGWLSSITGGASAGTTGTGTGFCMWVPATNVAGAGVNWYSPNNSAPANWGGPGYIDLVDSTAYRLRATMYCDQTAGGAIPFWTIGYNNVFYATGTGALQSNIFGGDHFQLDVAGGANGVGRTQGRDIFEYWFIPNAALTQGFRGTLPGANPLNVQAVVGPTYDTRNDINVSIRILDSNNAISTNTRSGTICLQSLRADRIPYANLTSTPVAGLGAQLIASASYAAMPDREGPAGGGTGTIVDANNEANFTLAPNFATDQNGGRKALTHYNPAGADQFLRVRPLANSWHDDELLLLKSTIRSNVGGAAGTVEGSSPVDLIFVNWDTRTSEIGGFHFTQKGTAGNMKWACAPRLLATTVTPQEYVSLFYTQNKSRAVAISQPDRIRGYLDFINSANFGTATDGVNPFSVTSMVLHEVDLTPFGPPVR